MKPADGQNRRSPRKRAREKDFYNGLLVPNRAVTAWHVSWPDPDAGSVMSALGSRTPIRRP